MRCPFCENLDTKVIDSRPTEEGHAIRRRRECEVCGKRFTTYEKVEENIQYYHTIKWYNGNKKRYNKRI